MSLILHGVALSPFVRKIRIVLNEKELDYKMKTVIPYATREEYSQINPLMRVPSLQIDDLTLCDSAVIAHYLEALHPTPPLIPNAPAARAQSEWLEKFGDYEIAQQATFGIFFQRMIAKQFGHEPDQQIIQRAITSKLPPLLNYLEEQLIEQQWFINNTFGLVDIAIATHLINMEYAGENLDSILWPSLSAHLQRFKERKSVSSLLVEESEVLKKLS